MSFEVEQKFPLSNPEKLLAALAARGVTLGEAELQIDCYYGHPVRDFAATDEALRIRRIGTQNLVTYKGPKLDRSTKTRQEIEVSLAPGDKAAADFAGVLQALSFRPVAEVRKRRRTGHLAWQGFTVEVALDEVERLGAFVELELIAEEDGLDRARTCLATLAAELDLSEGQRKSYLELLLAL